ncbi:MAG TPA: energy transducer TonB [Candidatus Angelobacter sp.]
MRNTTLASILCFSFIFASAEQAPSPQQLLDAVHKATDLASVGPYILQATLIVNPNDPKLERRGTLTIVRDHDRARFTLESDGRTEERVILGAKQYIPPGQETLFGMGLKDFDYSWDPSRPPRFATRETLSFGNVRKQKIEGHDAWCFDQKAPQSKTKLCFDAATSILLHESSSGKSHKEYSDYSSPGMSMYPQKVQIFRESLAPFEIDHISIKPTHPNDDLFKVPENAIEVEECDHEKPPVAISTPEPSFPKGARDARQQAVSVITVIVNNEGNVVSAQALGSDAYGFARTTLDTVNTWRFKPATCNGRPVAAEMNIEMDFRLY